MKQNLTRMEIDYAHLLEIDYDKNYKIQCVNPFDKIHVDGRQAISLNGKWNYSPDVFDTFIRKEFFNEKTVDDNGELLPVDFNFDEWQQTDIPCVFNNIKPEYKFYEGSFIFTRQFEINTKNRTYLRIGASNYETRIWINKKLVARHLGGFTPIYTEITDYLLDGVNRIVITVNNERKLEQIPSINYDWFNYGGVFRDVELFNVPKSFICDVHSYLVQDNNYNKIKFEIYRNGIDKNNVGEIFIQELNIKQEFYFENNYAEVFIDVNNLELWSIENPKLYLFKIKYNLDEVYDTIGYRQIEIKDNKFKLNGKDIFLKGICIHEEFNENARMFSNDDLEKMFLDLKDLGANFIRLTHYPHSEKVAKLADKYGFMLWEEIPVYWALKFENPETIQVAKNYMTELILRDRNRCSVITWGIGNENPDTDERFKFLKILFDMCKKLDSNRLVTAACLVNIDELKIIDRISEVIDFISVNEYYGWYYRDFSDLDKILKNSIVNKPIVISETGGEAVFKKFGHKNELYTEDCQENIYKKQLEIISENKIVQGITPWILYDYKTMIRLNSYQQGFNLKGLITSDRLNKKKAYFILRDFYLSL